MLIQSFNQIDKNDVSLCGGKATSLGFMIQNGFVIPDGFVITTEAFDLYQSIESEPVTNKILRQVQADKGEAQSNTINNPNLLSLINQIYQSFDLLDSEYVAVRSSATSEDSAQFSFAGQFDTFLNVTKGNLVEKVFECFQGLGSPRCIAYVAQTDLDISKIKIAVVVQAMVQSEVAGVAFTNHPVTKNKNQILIEAGYGLGEAVVSGLITPDSYLVDKNNLNLIEVDISAQSKGLFLSKHLEKIEKSNTWQEIPKTQQNLQKLSNLQIQELAKICIEIEGLYGFACDIEWALVGGRFYVVQSRAVTTN